MERQLTTPLAVNNPSAILASSRIIQIQWAILSEKLSKSSNHPVIQSSLSGFCRNDNRGLMGSAHLLFSVDGESAASPSQSCVPIIVLLVWLSGPSKICRLGWLPTSVRSFVARLKARNCNSSSQHSMQRLSTLCVLGRKWPLSRFRTNNCFHHDSV